MSLDITVHKVNKKEWDEYSNRRKVDYYESLKHSDDQKSGSVSYIGEAEGFPEITFLGYFYGVRGFTYFEEVENCMFTEFTRDMLREVDEWVKENDNLSDLEKTFFHSWYVAVVNSLQEDETILVVCDW